MPTAFEKHRADWINCTRCPLHLTRKQVVLARGTLPADVVFVGEAPGEGENTLGQPFVGDAGHLLSFLILQALADEGLARFSSPEVVGGGTPNYINLLNEVLRDYPKVPRMAWTNLVGCIPKDETTRKKKGEPNPTEVAACAPRVESFLDITSPSLIFAVGAISERQSGIQRWETRAKVIPLIHPAAILRADVSQRGLMRQRTVVNIADGIRELVDRRVLRV